MEPRNNEEEPTNATPSAYDTEKDEPPPYHGVQAAPENDEPPLTTALTEVSIPRQPPVGKPK